MAQFEISIPRTEGLTLTVEVRHGGITVKDQTGRAYAARELEAAAAKPAPPPPAAPPPVPAKPDVMSELFHDAERIDQQKSAKAAAELVLGLAMKAMKAESGAVYVSSINTRDLRVLAASGPAAASLQGTRVEMGKGTVGFAAQEGVAIAGANGEACAPAQREGRLYGAVYLLHKKDAFKAEDMGALDYLAGQFADYLIHTGQTDA